MTQTVKLPDGTSLAFPDGMSQEAMSSAIQKNFPQFAPAPKKSPREVVQGAIGTPQEALASPFAAGAIPEAGGPSAGLKLAGKLVPQAIKAPIKAGGDWLDKALSGALGKLGGETVEQKAGKVMRETATDPAQAVREMRQTTNPQTVMRGPQAPNPSTLVKGSKPTAAAASRDEGLLGLEKTTRTLPGAQEKLAAQNLGPNNLARTELLSKMARSKEELDVAVAKRTAQDRINYGKADSQFVNVDSRFNELMNRPIMKRAFKKADELARNEDVKLTPMPRSISGQTGTALSTRGSAAAGSVPSQAKQVSGRNLHYLKMALDQMMEKTPQSALGRTELRQVATTKSDFLKWAEERLPEYRAAREASAKAAVPVNRMRLLQELQANAMKSVGTDAKGNPILTRAGFVKALRNARPDLEKTITPAQMKTLDRIAADLDRSELYASPHIKQAGSDTIRNATAASVLGKLVGGHGWTAAGAKWLAKAPMLGWLRDVPPEDVKALLVDAMLDPDLAANLIEKANPKNMALLSDKLKALAARMPTAPVQAISAPSQQQQQGIPAQP